jgi:cell division protein FtsB
VFDFHEKRKIKSWVFSKPAIAILLVVSFFLGRSVYERYQKERETSVKHAERTTELAHARTHASALEAEVARIQSPRGIEEEIRDRFDVTKEGEQAVIVMGDLHSTTSKASPETAQSENSGTVFSWLFFWQ